ncbi:HAD family hydrolase [Bacteriovorax stolpii]|uniref:HAD family hydrolase n=1 Tax=Bacteriovorax stolpii TaxID=960 RepID=UPI00163C56CB|nr:HAD family hydrolase [Bacteriovorax stolpii]
MVIVFDLDDTLYDEKTFAISGFMAVSRFLAKKYSLSYKKCLDFMIANEDNRGAIFDTVLSDNGLFTKKLRNQCVSIYRYHKPSISLYTDAEACLERFKKNSIYIVTDGHKNVQLNKLKALKLLRDPRIKHCYRTNAYGKAKAKPNRHCFDLIMKREKVNEKEILYIGDNPYKDFIIKKHGFKTIRIRKGHFKDVTLDSSREADLEIKSLSQLTNKVISKIG